MTPGRKDLKMMIVSLLNATKEPRYHHLSDIINWDQHFFFFFKFKCGELDKTFYTQNTNSLLLMHMGVSSTTGNKMELLS